MTPDTLAQGAGQLDSVVHFIQLAIAPVFLLTAIGSMLGTMTNRIARIVGAQEAQRAHAVDPQHVADLGRVDRQHVAA